jgi:cytochrome d ubiquinol oxidase subunit I
VAGGTTLSAFWILVLNSWMQTPAGFEMRNGVAHATDWFAIIFNPSMPYRMTHMLIASGLTASFLIAGISAYRYLRGDQCASVLAAMKTGLYAAAILIPIQIFVGDLHGLNTLEHQPAKVAAMEGLWDTTKGAKMLFFAVPNDATRTNSFEIGVPKLTSFILTHDWDGEIKGLNDFVGKHPPMAPVFYAFRIMIGVGIMMLIVSWIGAYQMRRHGKPSRLMAQAMVAMAFSGWVATLAGWYTTEIGRQPYLVHGILTTTQAAAHNVTSGMIGVTLSMYLALYLLLISAFITVVFYMARRAGEPPGVGYSGAIMNPQPAYQAEKR